MASREFSELEIIKESVKHKNVAVGIVDVKSYYIESVDEISQRVNKCLQFPPGDCVIELEGIEWKAGPVSTVMGAPITNMIRCEVAERLIKKVIKLELLPSNQAVGNLKAHGQLEKFYESYRLSLSHLFQ